MSKSFKKSFCILYLAVLITGNCRSVEAIGRQGKRQVIDRESRLANENKNPGKEKGDIASKAAQEAKAASDAQNIAGKQASHQVKAQLADKALRAAKEAEAVLIGKVALVEQLAEETKETQSVEREGSLSLQRAHENLNAATRAAKDAHIQVAASDISLAWSQSGVRAILMPSTYATLIVDTLRRAVETAKSNLSNARVAADGARRSLNEKEQLLLAAKKRVEELKNRLQKAKGELAKTNQAAVRAEASAREARVHVNHDASKI